MLSEIAFGIVIAVMLISLIILFCILLGRLYIGKIKNYTALIYQKDLDFQKTLNTTIIETQEQVLNNISQDLHDDAGQQLTYINFQLENLKLDSPELNTELQPLSDAVRELSESIRSISHSLNHHFLMQQDLMKAIDTEVQRLRKNKTIKFDLKIQSGQKEFSINEKIVVYRIFQEAINNIFKHSKATAVHIVINIDPFVMEISDNGRGFDTISGKESKLSLGLSNMVHRAKIIGYQLAINSEPGKGTTIKLSETQ